MMNRFDHHLGRIDQNIETLGHRYNAIGSFITDFGQWQHDRDEFHQNVYNTWTSQQSFSVSQAGAHHDAPIYPAYPQHLMAPYPAYPPWEPNLYAPRDPDGDDDHGRDE